MEACEREHNVKIELAPIGIVNMNMRGLVTSVNTAVLASTGYSEHEIVGEHFTKLSFFRPKDIPSFLRLFGLIVSKRGPKKIEYAFVHKDGTLHQCEAFVSLMEAAGKRIGIQAMVIETTAIRQVERMLSEREEKYRTLFEEALDAIFVADAETGIILDCNRAASELVSREKSELIGKHQRILHPPEKTKGEFSTTFKQHLKEKEGQVLETQVITKGGETKEVAIKANVIECRDKKLLQGAFRDITDLKNAEKRLKETNMKLEVTNEKLHVVGGLTRHDVRNKLSAVTGNAYLLRRKLAGNPEALEQLADMESVVRNMEAIFEFANTYEKLGVEKLVNMNVGKAVDEAASLFTDLKGIKIVNECHDLTVLADSLLRQLFYNLIDNTLKYGEKTGQIRIYSKTSSVDQLELVYEDDGVGIPIDEKEKIFKEGFTSGKGTGYGLFMIKRMCEVYGWAIDETGRQGKGAQFTMSIPRIGSAGKANYQIQKGAMRPQESEITTEAPGGLAEQKHQPAD